MKKYLIILVLFFSACKHEAQETTHSGDFKIEFLFEKDGCKMYRFKDAGDLIYWANCEGRTSYETTFVSGKPPTVIKKQIQAVTTKH